MKIYVCHSREFDYKHKLYDPLKNSALYKKHLFIFPHDAEEMTSSSKKIISTSDLVIAEVSHPSTGLGIELGWAESMGKKILCMHQKNTIPSSSLKFITSNFIVYADQKTMAEAISEWIMNYVSLS
jgi:hypothetical protein